MKEIAVAILALIYITTTNGATIRMHYCMGELSNWGIRSDKSKTCDKCGMEESDKKENGCCKDEFTFVKNNADQKLAPTGLVKIQLLVVVLPVRTIEVHTRDFSSVIKRNPESHAPRRDKSFVLYIRNCVFLI